jgi:hypothetical protein
MSGSFGFVGTASNAATNIYHRYEAIGYCGCHCHFQETDGRI